MKEKAITRITAQLFFFMEGTYFSSPVLWWCCRRDSSSSQTPMAHFPPAHTWMNPISDYFYSLGDKGKGQYWHVSAWLCCSGGCTQLLLSALVCHRAVGYLVWELIPFPRSSSLPGRDFPSVLCICLSYFLFSVLSEICPAKIRCPRSSNGFFLLLLSSRSERKIKHARGYTKTSMVKKKKKKEILKRVY